MSRKLSREDVAMQQANAYKSTLKQRVDMLRLQYEELQLTLAINKLEIEHRQTFPELYKRQEELNKKEEVVFEELSPEQQTAVLKGLDVSEESPLHLVKGLEDKE